MENVQQLISELFSSPEVQAMVASLLTYLTANFGALLLFGIKLVKAKSKELAQKVQMEADKAQIKQEYQDQLNSFMAQVVDKVDALDRHVCEKIDTTEADRKAEILKQTVQLQEAIDETKKALNVDEILES